MNYKKRHESQLVTSCLQYLQVLENAKQIAWCDRLNSSKAIGQRSYRLKSGEQKTQHFHIRGCRKGTSDIIIILNSGKVIWCEMKMQGEGQRKEQFEFEQMIKRLPNHYYLVANCTDDLIKFIKPLLGIHE